LELEVRSLKKRLSRVEADLEYLPTITSFDKWTTLTLRDREMLEILYDYGVEGASTLDLAKKMEMHKPETSGRTIVGRRLKRIREVSINLKGNPLVVAVGRKHALNFEDYKIELASHDKQL